MPRRRAAAREADRAGFVHDIQRPPLTGHRDHRPPFARLGAPAAAPLPGLERELIFPVPPLGLPASDAHAVPPEQDVRAVLAERRPGRRPVLLAAPHRRVGRPTGDIPADRALEPVTGGLRDACLPANVGHRRAALGLREGLHDLLGVYDQRACRTLPRVAESSCTITALD